MGLQSRQAVTVQLLWQAVTNIQAAHYLTVAGTTVLFYDYLLALSDEVAYVWTASLSLPIVLFYIVRYLPICWSTLLIYHISFKTSDEFCRVFGTGQLIVQAITYFSATWLLSIRVLALYPGSKSLPYILYTFLALTHLSSFIVAAVAFGRVFTSILYYDFVHDCMGREPRLVGVAMLLLLPIDTLLVALQLYHNYLQRKILRRARVITLPLLSTLYMDGAIFFLVVFSMRLWTGVIQVAATPTLFYLSLFAEYALTSTAISRLFIHLRSVAHQAGLGHKAGANSYSSTGFGHGFTLEARIVRRDDDTIVPRTLPDIEQAPFQVPLSIS